jgi:hypothetical protein
MIRAAVACSTMLLLVGCSKSNIVGNWYCGGSAYPMTFSANGEAVTPMLADPNGSNVIARASKRNFWKYTFDGNKLVLHQSAVELMLAPQDVSQIPQIVGTGLFSLENNGVLLRSAPGAAIANLSMGATAEIRDNQMTFTQRTALDKDGNNLPLSIEAEAPQICARKST